MAISNICRIKSCGKPVSKRNLCNAHYIRLRRHSDPLGGGMPLDGRSKHPLHLAYKRMIQRCHNEGDEHFACYGGRGITVCERWRDDFWAFVSDMGPKPTLKHTVERIDNAKGYEPGNCHWATMAEQGRNKRNNRLITVLGRTLTIADWGRERGFTREVIRNRIRNGWSEEDAILTPLTRIRKHT